MFDDPSLEEFRDPQTYDPMTQIQHYTRQLKFLHPGGQQEEKTLYTNLRYVYPQEMEALLFYNDLGLIVSMLRYRRRVNAAWDTGLSQDEI